MRVPTAAIVAALAHAPVLIAGVALTAAVQTVVAETAVEEISVVKPSPKEQRYESGEEIHVGDRVRYAGDTGAIVFVIDRGEYSPEFPENDWSHYGTGFMIQTPAFALVMLDKADEDLELLAHATRTI